MSDEYRMNSKKPRKNGRIAVLVICCLLIGAIIGAVAVSCTTANKTADAANPTTTIREGKREAVVPETTRSANLGVLLASGGKTTSDDSQKTTTIVEGQRETAKVNVERIDTNEMMTASQIYASNVNSTVGITTEVTTNYFGYTTTTPASGSGFILTEDGYIVTNYHVIENSTSISVALYDGSKYDAKVVGYDDSNDIAVLKIDATGLVPVILGDSSQMYVGDDVIAIGNPLGELTFSLTAGKISALNRQITLENLSMDLIQTDCAINSGNSGGALFNMYGEVIGITNAKYSSSGSSYVASIDNIAFAIPINNVKAIIRSIIENGYYSKPFIGVSMSDLASDYHGFGLPEGAVIRGIQEGSPAEESGLQVNDIVTHVNGEEVKSASEFKKRITSSVVGDVLTLTVYRQGQTIELQVTVGEQQQTTLPTAAETTPQQQQQPQQQPQQQMPQDGYGDFFYGFPWEYFFNR
ncbi:MAG: trypsin-like peptidase domain-containing protein [Spirochaetales bacterium]|nr:trypsin-like peptidase domain-containing protein [Spirochaetales bacterium]